ncbi:MAG: alanine racemase, partial [Vicinamibacteraceae bacterium]
MASASATVAPLDVTVLAMVAARHGSPFYVADTGRLRANISALLAAFRRYYPKTSVAYSYKTNYLPAFIRVAHHLGACSEVVSRVELDLAMALGIPGDRIIFNGPVKTARDLALAHRAGACVNVDSLAEARLVAEIARTAGTDVSVGLRCHLGPLTPRSRFGVDLEAADGKTVVQTLDACARVRIAGLHCHYSGDRSASRYQERLSRMAHVHATVLG